MHNAKRSIPIFLLAALISLKAFPEPNRGGSNRLQFADLASFAILDEAALAQLDGGDLILAVDRQAKIMEVYAFNQGQLLSGGLSTLAKTTVKVTTEVVRNKDVSASLPKTAMVNTVKSVDLDKNNKYNPVQLPTGTYTLDSKKADVAGYGPGIHIAATVTTPIEGTKTTYQANDFFVHATSCDNTNGCVGVKNGMDTVMNAYNTTGGTKSISVTSYSATKTSSSSSSSTSASTASTSSSKPWYKFW